MVYRHKPGSQQRVHHTCQPRFPNRKTVVVVRHYTTSSHWSSKWANRISLQETKLLLDLHSIAVSMSSPTPFTQFSHSITLIDPPLWIEVIEHVVFHSQLELWEVMAHPSSKRAGRGGERGKNQDRRGGGVKTIYRWVQCSYHPPYYLL